MGWASDGVIAATQLTSWPEQLAAMAGRDLSQPYIAGTGCRSPLIAPLLTFLRLSGESAAADPSTLSCSPLRADVTLPVSNVSIVGASTRDALLTTPQNVADPTAAQLYQRVLQPGSTQVSGRGAASQFPECRSFRSKSGNHCTMRCSIACRRLQRWR